jgi:hypothetical protein
VADEEGNIVVAPIDFGATVKATGRAIREEHEAHIWHLDREGKVIRFRHRVDTCQHQAADGNIAAREAAALG